MELRSLYRGRSLEKGNSHTGTKSSSVEVQRTVSVPVAPQAEGVPVPVAVLWDSPVQVLITQGGINKAEWLQMAAPFFPLCPEPGDVRLVDGSSRCAGALEMFHSGQWRSVSGEEWSMEEVIVLCRQLDCGSAVATTAIKPARDQPGPDIWIRCDGLESALRECGNHYSEYIAPHVEVTCSGEKRGVVERPN